VETKKIFIIVSPTVDGPVGIYESRSTAERFIKGELSYIIEDEAVLHNGNWLGPIAIIPPSDMDVANDEMVAAKKAALEKAMLLGMTAEELALIKGK
jgi:hypothetical protein